MRVYQRHIISHTQISYLQLTIGHHKAPALTIILKTAPTTTIGKFTSPIENTLESSHRCKYTAPIVLRIGQWLQDITDLRVRARWQQLQRPPSSGKSSQWYSRCCRKSPPEFAYFTLIVLVREKSGD
jgi:hypothetical protein